MAFGPRTVKVIGIAAGVIALAVLIFALSALSRPDGGREQTASLDATAVLKQADQKLASGDTTGAVVLARKVLEADPENEHALLVLSRAGAGTPDAAEPPDAEPPAAQEDSAPAPVVDDTPFKGDIEDIAALLPTGFEGYSMGFVAAVGDDADVSATPEQMGMEAFRIQWAVRDRGSESSAKSYISKTSKVLFSKASNETVKVDGAVAYFGTDGRELATVVYRRGRHIFEVIVVADRPGSPEKLRPLAEKAARAFADAPAE